MHYIFGSWFDPFTHAHEAIIKNIKKKMRGDDMLHILVTDNDEKIGRTPLKYRVEMVHVAMANKNINYTVDVQKIRTYEYINWALSNIDPKDITIVIGEDEWQALLDRKWKFSDRLLKNYKFIVCIRYPGLPTGIEKREGCSLLDLGLKGDISSSTVREIFRHNPETHYKSVQPYISKVIFNVIKRAGFITDAEIEVDGVKYKKGDIVSNCLYNQNPINYAQLEKEWVENYKKQGWGKFANTVDVCALSGDEVMLIRRKKPPFMNYWCTPGGFFNHSEFKNKETGKMEKPDASLEYAAQREFREEAGLDIPVTRFTQIKTYSHMFDPRLRIIDTAFVIHVPGKDKKKAVAGDDAADVGWFDVNSLPSLGFHHEMIINDALEK